MSDDKKSEVFLYDLTDLTGRSAKSQRAMVIATVEMRRGTMWSLIFSGLPAVVTLAAAAVFLPPVYATLPAILVFVLVLLGLTLRQRRGMQLSLARGFVDKHIHRKGVFLQGGRIIDPTVSRAYIVAQSSQTNHLRKEVDEQSILEEALNA